MAADDHRSFADPGTEFELVRSDAGAQDGHHVGELTGEVRCAVCGAQAVNVDRIDHDCVDGEPCPQRDVRSDWFWTQQG